MALAMVEVVVAAGPLRADLGLVDALVLINYLFNFKSTRVYYSYSRLAIVIALS